MRQKMICRGPTWYVTPVSCDAVLLMVYFCMCSVECVLNAVVAISGSIFVSYRKHSRIAPSAIAWSK